MFVARVSWRQGRSLVGPPVRPVPPRRRLARGETPRSQGRWLRPSEGLQRRGPSATTEAPLPEPRTSRRPRPWAASTCPARRTTSPDRPHKARPAARQAPQRARRTHARDGRGRAPGTTPCDRSRPAAAPRVRQGPREQPVRPPSSARASTGPSPRAKVRALQPHTRPAAGGDSVEGRPTRLRCTQGGATAHGLPRTCASLPDAARGRADRAEGPPLFRALCPAATPTHPS